MPRKITASAADLATDLLGQPSFWSGGPARREDEATRVVRRGTVVLGRPALARSRALVPALALTVLVLVGGGAWGAWRSVSAYFTVAEGEGPQLVGLPPAAAAGAGRAAGTRPPGGSPLALLGSRGPELVEMPVLVGRPLEEARRRLEDLGLIVRQVRSAVSPDLEPGTVVDQSPDPGRRVRPSETGGGLTVSA